MSKVKEDIQITVEKVVGHLCDYCGRLEKDVSTYDQTWLHFSMSHQGWGNDSCESSKEYDVCSPECFLALGLKEGNESLKDYASQGAEIAEMPWEFFKKLAKNR